MHGREGPCRRGHRRRRAHRRHGLGGAEQHRGRQGPAADHRRQRQRALLRAHHRRPRQPPGHPAHDRRLREGAGLGQGRTPAHPARRQHRSTSRCTARRRASRTPSRRRACSRTSGLKYVGPIDGHDIGAVESALRRAKRFHGPVLVHCLTEKGRGYEPALADEADHFHTVGVMDPLTCEPLAPVQRALLDLGVRRRDRAHRRRARRRRRRSRRPCCTRSGLGKFAARLPGPGLGRRHRRAARRGLRGRARHRRPAPGRRRLRDLPQPRLRPAPDGRRPAPVRGHLRAGPGRRHGRRRRLAQRHVGHVDPPGRARVCGSPRRATPTSCGPSCGRPSPSTTRRPLMRFPKESVGAADPGDGPGRRHGRPAPRPTRTRRSCWSPSA